MSKNEHAMPEFYICPICGNLVEMIHSSGNPIICCGQEMEKITPQQTEFANEKHVPVYFLEDRKVCVKVGSIPHPMMEDHHICFVELVTDKGFYRKNISEKKEATTCFHLAKDEKVLGVLTYCNMHGLWISCDPDKEAQKECAKNAHDMDE